MNKQGVLALTSGVAVISILATMYIVGSVSPPSGPKTSDEHVVEFHVENIANPSKLEITTAAASSCAKKGCFKIKKKNVGEIKFIFTAPDNDWQLTEFNICRNTAKSGSDCDLTLWERLEFFASNDASGSSLYVTNGKGSIDISSLPAGSTTFYLFDQNSIKQDYFYHIKACNPNNVPECITTDPAIENKGRN